MELESAIRGRGFSLTYVSYFESLGTQKQSWIGQEPISLGKAFGLFRAAIAGFTTERTERNYMNQPINISGKRGWKRKERTMNLAPRRWSLCLLLALLVSPSRRT